MSRHKQWRQYTAVTFPLYTNAGNKYDNIRQYLKALRQQQPDYAFKSEKSSPSYGFGTFWTIYYAWGYDF